jgi:hypothetical protein
MIFIENNTFTEGWAGGGSALQSYYGARTVARYNMLNNMGFDQHGGGGVGARWWEFYGNTLVDSGGGAVLCLRAGSGVIYSNTGVGAIRMLQETGTYPANYQIGRGQNETLSPALVWNDVAPLLNTTSGCAAGQAGMVQFERDVYAEGDGGNGVRSGAFANLPTTCTTFQGYWASDQNTLYRCTATNTWTPYYRPYTYPHPLTQQ